jgi:hypothetical protein
MSYLSVLKWDESRHPRDKEGQWTNVVGVVRGVPRTSSEQARRDLVALGQRAELHERRRSRVAEAARTAWGVWVKDTQNRKKPLKPDGAAAKKLPSYQAAQKADEVARAAFNTSYEAFQAANKEALRQLVVPESERSRVKFRVPTGQLHSDPTVEAIIARRAEDALAVLRQYDGSGTLLGPAIPADQVEKAKEILGNPPMETDPDGTIRIVKNLRLTRAPGPRAAASPFGVQIGDTRDLDRVVYHEVGHHIEFASQEIYEAAVAVRTALATSTTTQSMNTLMKSSGFREDEIGVPGRFLDAYAGKVYPSEAAATEMMALGVEWYLTDPIRFAREAPEHFKFTWDVMHGKYRRSDG